MERLDQNKSLDDRLRAIWDIINANRDARSVSPEYSELIQQASGIEYPGKNQNFLRFGLLPGLCCQAAGGEASWADSLSAAWLLFYAAADIMDSVQDQDEPAAWWRDKGPGVALSAATGLYFYASLLLSRSRPAVAGRNEFEKILGDFYASLINMASGQYADLNHPEPTIEQYWNAAESKSGTFFALACRSGARLALEDQPTVEHYSQYGRHLGLLVQIFDDLEDLKALSDPTLPVNIEKFTRSLPVVYSLQVLPASAAERLRFCLVHSATSSQAGDEAIRLIEESGAVLFLLAEIERHQNLSRQQLSEANASQPAGEILVSFTTFPPKIQ